MEDLKLMAKHLGPYRRDFIIALVCCGLEASIELFIPVLTASLIDEGVMLGNMDIVWLRGSQMIACGFVALAFGLTYARFAARTAMGLGARLREAEYAAVQRYAFENLDHFETSSLITRMTSDITVIQNVISSGIRPGVRGVVVLVMGLVYSCAISLELAAVFFVLMPLLGIALMWIVAHVAPLYRVLQTSMDQLNEVIQECSVAVRAIKAFVRGEWSEQRFGVANDELAQVATQTFSTAVLNAPMFQICMYSASVLILLFGGQMILAGTLMVGELTGFMSYVLQVSNSLIMLSNVFLLMTRALTSAHRIAEVLEEEPTIEAPARACTEVADGAVELEHVSFRYAADAEARVLSDINVRITAGSTVGVLGGTGSGKSTLLQLLPRLYDASEGVVRVGGRDVRDYDLCALRDAVGIVLQKNVLFTGTVRENLLWGNPDADDAELLHACELAAADEFLERIGGLDADLGAGGAGVSGGQKQRLCIARALLNNPKVLIFDDSTSAVDMTTDARIRDNLAQLTGMTKIIVAQRVASVMDDDQIIILDDGHVVATGSHDELLASCEIYQDLYHTQVGGDSNG